MVKKESPVSSINVVLGIYCHTVTQVLCHQAPSLSFQMQWGGLVCERAPLQKPLGMWIGIPASDGVNTNNITSTVLSKAHTH